MGRKFKVYDPFGRYIGRAVEVSSDFGLIGLAFLLVAVYVILLVGFVTAPIWLGKQIFDEGWENVSWGKKGWWLFITFYMLIGIVEFAITGEWGLG